ncbi:membrane protein-like protein [Rubrobacter xylanophilus DSM 9941]|uniref:Membrane protein-like protein n=1 Tax=Rubrobacter xylanophilus (strain DSM 9941 / JCM 11954 / NBRC 16129 / PRD-1) TaxID=266117 RepID=Q1ATY1_RUBXD|nr:carotenoid biosynthesis protein [Rubrobacter xylanophilus]ABG05147.1 membrane protein-like protein [Rubrobacter xylanophilus DSM 9941]
MAALRPCTLLLPVAALLFFCAAGFAVRFPDPPGAWLLSLAAVAAIAAPPLAALLRLFGPARWLAALALLSAFAFAVESLGVATGWPYGRFYYGEGLGPLLGGLVPYLLPVSYVPLVVGAVAAARHPRSRPLWTLRSAALLTLIDGVLDPGAALLGFWVWPGGGPYYGVPASNYLGWLLSGAVSSAVLVLLWPRGSPAPPALLDGTLLALAFWTGVAAFGGLALPAALGVALLAAFLARRAGIRGCARVTFLKKN